MSQGYFVRIDDATELRRRILESSKGALHGMRSYHELVRIRGEKLALMQSLRKELKELTILLNRIEGFVPNVDASELATVKNAPDVSKSLKQPTAKKASKKKSRTEELPKIPPGPSVFVGKNAAVKKHKASQPKEEAPPALPPPPKKSPEALLEEQLVAIDRKLGRM